MTTTLPDERPLGLIRRARLARRTGAALLVGFVLAGAVGLFGTRTGTAQASAAGYRVEVTYPTVSRPGHAVRFGVLIHRDGGLGDPVRVRMRGQYFDLFDENAFDPDAVAQTSDATYTYLEYAPPPGNELFLSSDTRIEPDRQRGESGEVAIIDAQGVPLVTVSFRTRIWP